MESIAFEGMREETSGCPLDANGQLTQDFIITIFIAFYIYGKILGLNPQPLAIKADSTELSI